MKKENHPTVTAFFICIFSILIGSNILAQQEVDENFIIIDESPGKIIIAYHFSPENADNAYTGLNKNSCSIAIPNGATADFKILHYQSENYSEINALHISTKSFPKQIVQLLEPKTIRGIDMQTLTVFPFQYDQEIKEIIVYTHLEIQISFSGGNMVIGENRLRNRYWDYIYMNMFLNYNSLPKKENNNILTDDPGAEYLIICPNDPVYQQWADTIKNFRTNQGILTAVMTLEDIGGNTAIEIEDFIDEAYNTWDIPPVAILCLGDHGTDPDYQVIAPIWDNYCVSDNLYADVNNDDLPDIIIARMCAENATQLETMVTKFINYEKSPPVNPDFYNNPITSCNFHQSGYFQLLTESVAGFYENILGKNTNRINVGPNPLPLEWGSAPNVIDIVQFFGPDGLGYIPATPGEVNCSWNGSTQDVIDGINNGAFMLLHRSEAYEQGWGQPPFTNDDINGLTNIDLTFIWSPDNLIGKFSSSSECFAEKFHRHNYGALGVIAASEISYGFINEIYTWGAWDFMWPEFLPESGQSFSYEGVYPAFANAAGKYYLEQTPWPINPQNKKVAFHTLHYFGDAFTCLYTEMPLELNVSHNNSLQTGDTSFEVMANEGSLIGLSVNNELIGVAKGTGEPLEIQIIPQTQPGQMLVTVTKQNFYRYENMVSVVEFTSYTENTSNDELFAFPNPSKGKFALHVAKEGEIVDFVVINSQLKIVVESSEKRVKNNEINVDLDHLPKGVYFIILNTNSEKFIRKVIIQ